MFSVIIYTILAGFGISLVSAPLGCCIIWRRMSYFGDTLAHSSLLGAAIGILLNIDTNISIIVSSLLISYLLLHLQSKTSNSQDSILGILSHSSLAIGVVIISMTSRRIDVKSYLFGDILAISNTDIAIIYSCMLVTSSLFFFLWRSIISTIIHPELAKIDGINTKKIDLLITLTTALVIACNIKIIGVLLVTAMLIIPAATSQIFATSPFKMVCFAAVFGFISIILGLLFCWFMDTPTGPSIVVCSFMIFLLAKIFKNIVNISNTKA